MGQHRTESGSSAGSKLWQRPANWSISPEISLCAQHCGKAEVPSTDGTGLARAVPCAAGESSSSTCAYRMWTRPPWRRSDVPSTSVCSRESWRSVWCCQNWIPSLCVFLSSELSAGLEVLACWSSGTDHTEVTGSTASKVLIDTK